MGVLGAVVRTTQTYPALLPVILLTVCVAIWARRKRRFWLMGVSVALSALFVFFYTGRAPAGAMEIRPGPGEHGPEILPEDHVHASHHLHARFPEDFPIPAFFHHEHTQGDARHGSLTVRFRFAGSPDDAVRDLAEVGRRNGWQVERPAPHRLVFRKGVRSVRAWFGFPGHSLVLDIPDPR